MSSRIYVASSWHNPMHQGVVHVLRAAGLDVYDFQHPEAGNNGFHWSEVMPSYRKGVPDQKVPAREYLAALDSPQARRGFHDDVTAMESCDTCILILPCGRSSHLELGWFTGRSQRTAVLLDADPVVPELMYKLVDFIAPNLHDLLGWLGVKD